MSLPHLNLVSKGSNKLIHDEMQYDIEQFKKQHKKLTTCLTDEHKDYTIKLWM